MCHFTSMRTFKFRKQRLSNVDNNQGRNHKIMKTRMKDAESSPVLLELVTGMMDEERRKT